MDCDILIIRGDGGLAKRKLWHAPHHLEQSGCSSDSLRIVALPPEDYDSKDWVARVRQRFDDFQDQSPDETLWLKFASRLHYVS